MKKKADHVFVRPTYYRGNFDYGEEGPYNRLNKADDNIDNDDYGMVVSEEVLEEIKHKDIEKKRQQNMANSEGNKKIAVIRGDRVRECPFGLPITDACKCAGDSVYRMANLDAVEDEDQKKDLAKANRLVYLHHKTNKQCPFADKIIKDYDKVDCDYGDTGQAERSVGYQGSPLYPRTFTGMGGAGGLYSYPLGFYADNNESRNLFFGLFSFLGTKDMGELVKIANKYDDCGEEEKADVIDNLLKKLQDIRQEYNEQFDKIKDIVMDLKNKYQNTRQDSGILFDLMNKW